jgi:cell division septal protein FtsQ
MAARQPARNQRNSSRKQRKQQHLLDVKVRSRAATRQAYRRVFAWVSALMLICAAVAGSFIGGRAALRRFFWQNPDYNLAEVEIHTDGPLTRDQIMETASIHEGVNIFSVKLGSARKALMDLPQVERAEIERVLPNKLSIDITERKPVAWVADKEDSAPGADPGPFLIDHGGILMHMKSEVPEYYHLPVICGVNVGNYEAGEILDLPEVLSALELIHLTGENPARYQVRNVDVSKGYCMVVTDEHHGKITFPLDNIGAQLERLWLLLANIDASKREIQTVNLLVQRNVPVTFAPTPDPNAANAATDGTDGDSAPTPSPQPSPSPAKKPAAASDKPDKTTVKRASAIHKPSPSHHSSHSVSVPTPIPPAHHAVPLSPFQP